MIPKEFIIKLLGQIDLVEVINQYVPLKKAGSNYEICCPFHQEKTPSFKVSREKRIYHCFGCGVGGNAITFMMEYVGLSYVEAIEKLASMLGISVPRMKDNVSYQERKKNKRKEDLFKDFNLQIANYFFRKRSTVSSVEDYLKQRGLTSEIIEKYQIGYAPEGNYIQEVFANSFQYKELTECGLLIEKGSQFSPRFRNRVMFPIRDREGGIIGFGGRVIERGEPKYLNSPETLLFNKSHCLYGLFEAKEAIRSSGRVIVVEGYMDVVSMSQFGLEYVVAALGTATSGAHFQLLFRFTNHIYFCFDGDEAGRKAAWRALVNSLEHLQDDKIIYFILLPESEDPDSYVRKYGKEAFESFIEKNAIPFSQFFLQHLLANKNLQYGESRAEIIQEAKPLLLKLKAFSLKFMIMKDISSYLGIQMIELKQLIGEKETEPFQSISYRPDQFPVDLSRPIDVLSYHKKMIRWLLINPNLASYIELPDYLEYSEELQCLLTLSEVVKKDSQIKNAVQLAELMKETKFSTLINEVLLESFDEDSEYSQRIDIEQNFKQGIEKIKRDIVKTELFELKELMKNQSLNETEERLLLHLLENKC